MSINKREAEKTVKRRTFLGCATCRKRKVKCDGRKPKCARCEKANRECEGYGLHLKFNDIVTVGKGGTLVVVGDTQNEDAKKRVKRQQLPFMKFPVNQSYGTFAEIDNKLEELESFDEMNSDKFVGPFGLLCISSKFNQDINKTTIQAVEPSRSRNKTIQPTQFSIPLINEQGHDTHFASKNEFPLPSLTTMVNSSYKKSPSITFLNDSLPLVPALKLNYERKKHQEDYDAVNKLDTKFSTINIPSLQNPGGFLEENLERPIWIHPRLEIDAILTYQTLIGNADVQNRHWDSIKRVIFAERYDTTRFLNNRIQDKIPLKADVAENLIKKRIFDVVRALDDGKQICMNSTTNLTFTSLLRSHKIQELIRLFVKSQPSIMHLSFKGSVFDTIVIPTLYKIVGELMVFESSVDGMRNWGEKEAHGSINFQKYCSMLKQTYCMVALSITSFSQYKIYFCENGIYDGSLSLFKSYVAFREMSLVNLAILVKPFINSKGKAEISDGKLVDMLIKIGLFNELVLTLILAIYQDSSLDIIINYSLLYGVLDEIKLYYFNSTQNPNDQTNVLWEWFRYLRFFHKSCSKIDLENYEIDEEGFEDVKADYNLIRSFEFDDYFSKNEYNQIVIKSSLDSTAKNRDDRDDRDDGDDDESVCEDDSSSEVLSNDEENWKIPSRLASKLVKEDKPPRAFTIRFQFDETKKQSDISDCSDTNSDVDLCDNSISEDNILHGCSKNILHERKEKTIAQKSAINELTGLSTKQNKHMSLNEREQLVGSKNDTDLLQLSNDDPVNNPNMPSVIELSFGIPISLLELMEKTLKLADHKNWCLRKKVFPRNFPRICCDLEDELVKWKLNWDLFSEEKGTDGSIQFHGLLHKALYHLTVAFYNSILMFFFRLIKDIDPQILQDHVVSTIDHLEALRSLSLRSDFSKEMKIYPPFWCFFIAGSDALSPSLQHRYDELARKWYVAGNKWIGKQIMLQIWKTVGENGASCEGNSWLDIIKSWEISGYN